MKIMPFAAMGISGGINVKDYGAIGDGITDDTAAIQTAINACPSGSVFFPDGEYLITQTINMKSRVNLLGIGKGSHIFSNTAFGTMFSGISVVSLSVSQMWIQGNMGTNVSCLKFDNANTNDITIDSCWLSGFGLDGAGVYFTDGSDIKIRDNNIFGGDGLGGQSSCILAYVGGVENLIITGNICDGNNNKVSQGIYSPQSKNMIVSNNICRNFNRHGIIVSYVQGPGEVVVSNNICYNNGWTGIYLQGGSRLGNITGNILRNNGLWFEQNGPLTGNIVTVGSIDGNNSQSVAVTGNVCYDPGPTAHASICLDKGNLLVEGNLIIHETSTAPGIYSSLITHDVSVIGNALRGNAGIDLRNGPQLGNKIAILNNDVGGQIFTYGLSNLTISGNICNNGINVMAGGNDYIRITNNQAKCLTGNAIYFKGNVNTTSFITGNIVQGKVGIKTNNYCREIVVENNEFVECETRYEIYGQNTSEFIGGVMKWNSGIPPISRFIKGDRVMNTNPIELGEIGSKYIVTGWICTVSGTQGTNTPATFVEIRALTGN